MGQIMFAKSLGIFPPIVRMASDYIELCRTWQWPAPGYSYGTGGRIGRGRDFSNQMWDTYWPTIKGESPLDPNDYK